MFFWSPQKHLKIVPDEIDNLKKKGFLSPQKELEIVQLPMKNRYIWLMLKQQEMVQRAVKNTLQSAKKKVQLPVKNSWFLVKNTNGLKCPHTNSFPSTSWCQSPPLHIRCQHDMPCLVQMSTMDVVGNVQPSHQDKNVRLWFAENVNS